MRRASKRDRERNEIYGQQSTACGPLTKYDVFETEKKLQIAQSGGREAKWRKCETGKKVQNVHKFRNENVF